jgi:hypothetical protein
MGAGFLPEVGIAVAAHLFFSSPLIRGGVGRGKATGMSFANF